MTSSSGAHGFNQAVSPSNLLQHGSRFIKAYCADCCCPAVERKAQEKLQKQKEKLERQKQRQQQAAAAAAAAVPGPVGPVKKIKVKALKLKNGMKVRVRASRPALFDKMAHPCCLSTHTHCIITHGQVVLGRMCRAAVLTRGDSHCADSCS